MRMTLAALGLLALVSLPLSAWNNHAQLAYLSLGAEAWAQDQVRAETLDAFVAAEAEKLPDLLSALEAEARRDIPAYAARPDALAFTGKEGEKDRREAFLKALRVNTAVPFLLYAQLAAGAPRDGRPDLPEAAVMPPGNAIANPPFKTVAPGTFESALEVLATASDEPDYGMDIGLFENNQGPLGTLYGFGIQPFGNPALSYGSQAPFHMAFAHEDPLIALLAPFTKTAYADWRFRTYSALARFAFAEGHAYWGWRFAGWALHYLGDLSQPYHASMVPGKPAGAILWLFAAGSQARRDGELVLLSNRHLLLEDYLYGALADPSRRTGSDPLVAAFQAPVPGFPTYRSGYLFDVVSLRAYSRGRAMDALVASSFPTRFASDPGYDFGASGGYAAYAGLRADRPDKAAALEKAVMPVFADVGASFRAYLSWVHGGAAEPGRKVPVDLRGPAYLAVVLVILGAVLALLLRRLVARRRTAA